MDENALSVLFGLFHSEMRKTIRKNGRKNADEALRYWEASNSSQSFISPLPFNIIAKACLSSQASSASSERLFSDLGRLEGAFCQTLLSTTLQMKETIRLFVRAEL